MADNFHTTNPPDEDPSDIVTQLYVLATAAELSVGEVNRKQTAAVAREAAGTIRRLRRQIEGLKARLAGIQAGNKTVRCR